MKIDLFTCPLRVLRPYRIGADQRQDVIAERSLGQVTFFFTADVGMSSPKLGFRAQKVGMSSMFMGISMK